MPFVKLDCGILNSTLWFERTAREIFITSLLMAEPLETTQPTPQIAIGSLDLTGWSVPPGWYGFVPAAGVGILHRAGITDSVVGMEALASLGNPEASSRSKDHDGRRLVRVDGGFIVLNYMKYRERDYTTAERSKRYRERLAASHRDITTPQSDDTETVTQTRDITQAEAEVDSRVQKERSERKKKNGNASVNGRSRRPIFQGQRFVVFDWMLEDMSRTLGSHTDNFDLHTWFFDLDGRIAATDLVLPKDEQWPWLQAELIGEARKRGLPIATANAPTKAGKLTTRMAQAITNIANETK